MPKPVALIFLCLNILGTTPSFASDDLRAQRALQRVAHLTYNAELLVGLQADGFTVIDGGRVDRPTRELSRALFERYFQSVRFMAWDDIEPPVITMSEDGRMATVVVTKLVRTVARAQAQNPDAGITETRFAWLEAWRLGSDGWRMIQLASTRQP